MPQLAFFLGKGGVGKTTLSSAYAVHCARGKSSERVVLISTDPAHSLQDILQKKLTSRASRVTLPGGRGLHVWQLDSEELFRKFLSRYREQILSVIDAGAIFSRSDIEPLIDSALPGMAEMSALLALQETLRSGRYDRIVVDTAPFGHTLRLFELPGHFQRFLNFLELAASRDLVLAAHFGGLAGHSSRQFLSEWQALAESLRAAFGEAAELFLVTTPEKFALHESVRCIAELQKGSSEMAVKNVILNRAIVARNACSICNKKRRQTEAAHRFLSHEFPDSHFLIAEDPGSPVVGVENLARFGQHVFSGKRLKLAGSSPKPPPVAFRSVAWPVLDSPLCLVLGKGGVGKTTISAGIAVQARRQRRAVDICSVDPAPSLDDVFGTQVGSAMQPVLGDSKLRACEMDAVALFREWVREIRASIDDATTTQVSGIHVDLSFERQLLSALLEIVPPGVDEILAIFRIVDMLSRPGQRIVIDMAPTGHALELLRMPERILSWTRPLLKTLATHRTLAVARDAAVRIAQVGQRARELSRILSGDGRAADLYVVMLAEPLPDRETERLMRDLQKLGLASKALFVNRVLFARDVGKCRRCLRAMAWQHSTLIKLKKRCAAEELYIARSFPDEIIGEAALRSFTGELWQLA